jgi:phage/plasmid-associated DNA primase
MRTKIDFNNIGEFEFRVKDVKQLWTKDLEEARKREDPKKMYKMKDREENAIENSKCVQYLQDRVYSAKNGGKYIIEDGKLAHKNEKTWGTYAELIKAQSQLLYKPAIQDIRDVFAVDVYAEDFIIDMENARLNLAKKFNYSYSATKSGCEYRGHKIITFMKEVVCSGNMSYWECLKLIIACMAQRKQSHVILFLCGLEGIGKTFFCNILRILFGESFVDTSEQVLTGEDKFNACLVGSVAVCLEETGGAGNNPNLTRALKNLADSQKLVARAMYANGYEVRNLLNIIVCSNFLRDMDTGNRKTFAPEFSNKFQQNKEYFADLKACLTDDCLQYLFNYFYSIKVPEQVPIPATETKDNYKENHMNFTVRFLIEVLLIQQPQGKMIKTMRQVYDEYFVPWSEKNLKVVTGYDNFYFYANYYTERVFKEDGKTPKTNSNGTSLFDFSENVLYNKIIVHSKELSVSKFGEWKEKLALKNTPCDDYDDEVEKLKEQVVNLQKQVKELQQQLEKPKENDGAEKKRKVLNMDKKAIKNAVDSLQNYI